jgi:hypothetical protein
MNPYTIADAIMKPVTGSPGISVTNPVIARKTLETAEFQLYWM